MAEDFKNVFPKDDLESNPVFIRLKNDYNTHSQVYHWTY